MPAEKNLRASVARNASANLVRLGASGMVAVLLPPFLVRMLPTDTYSAWAVLLQLTLYVGLLDFGIQTAVARFVAHADELHDSTQRDGIASTAVVLLVAAAALALSMVALLAWRLPYLFPNMPAPLRHGARIAMLLMGGSFALGLPFSAIHSIFVGLHRNEIPAALVVLNRFAMAALILGVVFHRGGLAAMGAAVAVANFASYAIALSAWQRWAPEVRLRLSLVSRGYGQRIGGYSVALAVWFAGMLMVSGLDLTIVAKFDYSATAFYAVAATLTGFVAQAQGAIFAALLPASAVLSARNDALKLGDVLTTSTRYGMFILLAMVLALISAGRFILRIWVGSNYAVHSITIMEVLLVANVVRLAALPYATMLLGTNQQKKVILSPLAEGVTNLLVSILGAYLLGAIGVAIGTLVGSFVGLGLHLFHNMPRTSAIAVDRTALVTQGLLRPLACAVPVVVVLLFQRLAPTLVANELLLWFAIAAAASTFLLWTYGLARSERSSALRWLGATRSSATAATRLKAANG
jgi:O-antigen/teichoic acid export membrane protein